MRKYIETVFKKCGVVFVPDWRAVRLVEERHLARLLREFDIDCVFDVGANVGQYGQMLRKYVGYRGQIISFEPHPVALTKLRKASSGDALWHIEPFALGRISGSAQFHALQMSELASFHGFSNSTHASRNIGGSTVMVDVKTLETYFPQAQEKWNFKRPFLKLDTQGFDLEVAKGAGPILHKFLGLQSEIAFQNIYEGAPDYLTSIRFYEASGFRLSQLVPFHEIHFPELVEMDAIMVRVDLIESEPI